MKKAIVIGCPGCGKSTFSKALAKKTGLPLCHLDLLYWNPDKTTVSKELFRERLSQALAKGTWIIDGNYASTMELRIAACDTVFFFDLPVEVCLDGIRARRGKPRSDLPWVERDTEEDTEFLNFIRDYNAVSRPKVLALLAQCPDKHVVIFQSRAEADAYLQDL